MRIGVDIDDTITNSWECFIPYYAKMFNIDEETLHKSLPYYYAIKPAISLDEYFERIRPVYDEVVPKVTLKPGVKEVIDKLYDEGHHIFFITARGRGHTDPYKDSKEYLDKHKIKYDKIIVDSGDKSKVCQREHIDLFIDDSAKHCKAVSKLGIDVLMFDAYYNQEYHEFKHVKSWDEIYEYIKGR